MHGIWKCRNCEKVLRQCKCMKSCTVHYLPASDCPDCKGKTMDNEESGKLVIKFIEDHLGLRDLKPSSSLTKDMKMDSLDLVELVMSFEERFGIDIEDDVAEGLKTVQDLIDLVVKK